MRKFIVFDDGGRKELTPITYEEFLIVANWTGGSDIAWNYFKHVNNFREIDDFNDEAMKSAKIVLEQGDPDIKIDLDYWDTFCSEEWAGLLNKNA